MSEMKNVEYAARKIAEWTTRRDEAIRLARANGFSLRDIAEAADVSHGTVATIAKNPV